MATATMASILTASSGKATPNTECNTSATHGFSGAASSLANGARTTPNSEMLAAPSRNAVQTFSGGPGRSSAAITSHRISSAGATAAVPITVGRDSRRFIETADRATFPYYLQFAAFEHDLFGKPASTHQAVVRGHAFCGSCYWQPRQIFPSCAFTRAYGR